MHYKSIQKNYDTSKIGKYLEELVNQNYLQIIDGKYHANIAQLLKEILEHLRTMNIELDDLETNILKELLEQNKLFFVLEYDILYRIISQPPRIHKIDALEVISNNIGMVCTFAFIPRKDGKKLVTKHAERKTTEGLSKELDEYILKEIAPVKKSVKGSKSVKKKKYKQIDYLNNSQKFLILSAKILQKMKLDTLEKLGKLWNQHDGYMIAETSRENLSKLTK